MLLSQSPQPSPSHAVSTVCSVHICISVLMKPLPTEESEPKNQQDKCKSQRESWGPAPSAARSGWKALGISRLRLVALVLEIRAEGYRHAQSAFLSSLSHWVHSHWPRAKMPPCLKYNKRETWLWPWLCPSGPFLQPLAKLPFCEADGSSCEVSLTKQFMRNGYFYVSRKGQFLESWGSCNVSGWNNCSRKPLPWGWSSLHWSHWPTTGRQGWGQQLLLKEGDVSPVHIRCFLCSGI